VSLNILVEPDPDNERYVVATERLAKTEDGRLVPEADPEARWFYCIKGERIPAAEAEAGGLKSARPAANKQRKPAGDK
jgi:hypothetical protein